MNPFLSKEMARERINDLRRQAGDEGLTVRAANVGDTEAVRLLAALDSVPMPAGDLLVAEVDRELVAALPLDGGRALADPFRPTQHVVALLELRAKQLRDVLRTA